MGNGFLWVLVGRPSKKLPIRTHQNLSEPIPPELIKKVREVKEFKEFKEFREESVCALTKLPKLINLPNVRALTKLLNLPNVRAARHAGTAKKKSPNRSLDSLRIFAVGNQASRCWALSDVERYYSAKISSILIAAVATGVPGPKIAAAPSL